MNQLSKIILWLTVFSIAMGFMETAVVVYLREIYYPHGFNFPLAPIQPKIAVTEFLREAATIIMLAGIGILAGKNKMQRFAYFIYAFAIWDIFYYVFLKILLNWPESLFTWDILFLIPVPWVGPVLAPCIVSLTMIVLAMSIILLQEKGFEVFFRLKEYLSLILGSIIIIGSFLWDYLRTIYNANTSTQIWHVSSKQSLLTDMASYVPEAYNWWIFSIGEAMILYGIICFIIRIKRDNEIESSNDVRTHNTVFYN